MSTVTMTNSVAGKLRARWQAAPRPRWLIAPVMLIVAIPVADGFLPPDVHIAHLLVVAVAITAMGTGPRATALVGALAVLALISAGVVRRTLATESVVVELAALTVLCALLAFFTHLREGRERELVRVRSVSDAAQRVVLRPLPERAGPVSLASAYRSAEADTGIGGDLYAVARTSGSTRLVIGDVRGKGLATISDTAIVLGAFRAAAHREMPLPDLVAYVEDAVRWGLREFSEPAEDAPERFVTAVVLDIPDDRPLVHVISCGHPPPLLLRRGTATATTLAVPEPAPPLGLGGISDGTYSTTAFPFAAGERLLLYTDGVTEARDSRGVFYPLAERAAAWADHRPEHLLRRIAADLEAHVGGRLHDDMAMIILERNREPAAA
ncbi:PP2C family protein-serine/threonine phosphatase [Streptomyces carpinensis]|uniref:PP2C family protein-serine/threonine phosphatase n=1 Tax=Streptomyces carpinensis TaxID=66369 RepID=A0ABV1WGH7_9ACTN|nr:PP2C family protein-serine/threonine phosphatase [Streptomyces carpinensis]